MLCNRPGPINHDSTQKPPLINMHPKFIVFIVSAGASTIGALSSAVNEAHSRIDHQSPTPIMESEMLSNALDETRECPAGTYACGSLCCPSPGTCSVDVTANFHCCQDNTFCAANTTNVPISAGSRASSTPLIYWFTIMFSVVLASNAAYDMLGNNPVSGPLSTFPSPSLSAVIDEGTELLSTWTSARADTKPEPEVSSTQREVTATKRQIAGPGCGGFDTDCQQTCPPGWATCETSTAETVSSRRWTVLAAALLFFASFLAFVR